jgi:predicted RNA-binding Zn ribbon-like protein
VGVTSRTRWVWLGDHLAVDFANTTIGLADRREELIGTVAEFREWVEAEPAWLPPLGADSIDLAVVLRQRDATDRLLRNAALQRPLDPEDVELVNDRVRAAGVSRLLTTVPGTSRLAADAGFPALLGVLAAATVDLLGREDLAAIAVCEAPGCGQVFHRSRRNQRWCSPGCGNRARVDRHRHRNPAAGAASAR